ncbi:MAG: CapA family protein [Chloroflexi bacterium]|nr:CapA family protein [Chloroflexota bacterium]
MSPEKISILGVGDIIPDFPNPEWLFEPALPTLKQADILFGQLESNLSEKGEPQTQALNARAIPPEKVSALTYAGFDVMSFASNHTLDRGDYALLETIDVMRQNQIAIIGVGKNIDEARKPAIIERNGTRVGFLAYCSVLPKGYEARSDRPGCTPVRVSTSYQQADWQPGALPRVISIANKDDLAAMVSDIRKLRPQVDILVMSIHWGLHFVPALLAMYQKEVGYAAIDAGVDLILGHHAHILKGIEVYKGKVIFYSLCNFVMPAQGRPMSNLKEIYNIKTEPGWNYDFPADSRKSIIAKCLVSAKKIEKVSYLPLMINKDARPEVLPRADKRSSEVFEYVDWCTQNQGLNARFSWDGNEVAIHT